MLVTEEEGRLEARPGALLGAPAAGAVAGRAARVFLASGDEMEVELLKVVVVVVEVVALRAEAGRLVGGAAAETGRALVEGRSLVAAAAG